MFPLDVCMALTLSLLCCWFQEENVYTDRESQLEAIEKTFSDIKEPLTHHYSKPGVTAVEELPVFPDFALWKYPCAQVIFDSDPAPVGRPMPAQLEEMSQAMIRLVVMMIIVVVIIFIIIIFI